MPKHLKIIPERCTGCKSCELACSLKNGEQFNPAGSRIRALTFLEGKYPLPYHYVFTCRQCTDAPCLTSCSVAAIYRSRDASKTVLINREACIGCGKCVTACPFGAMFFDREKKNPFKCELCGGQPACAEVCPSEAIVFTQRRPFYAQGEESQKRGCNFLVRQNAAELKGRRAK